MPDDVAAAAASPQPDNLTKKVFQGGVMMTGRQLVSMALSLIGLLVITRMIGPSEYGPFVAAMGICSYAQNLGQAGIGIYLVRASEAPSERTYHVATTILVAFSCILALGIDASLPLITHWVPMPGLAPMLAVLTLSVILQTMTVSAAARLERALDFRRVAMIEAGGLMLYYGSALPLVFLRVGVWSLVFGYMLQQVFMCLAFHIAARYRPRLVWDRVQSKAILSYTLAYAASDWTWQMRGLVNPLIAGHFLSAASVGQIGLAIRMLELLSFTKTIAYRLSVAVLAKVQDQPERLTKAITDGIRLQTLALGPVLLGFSWFGTYILTLIFGERWAPVMTIYPFLALSYLTNANFNLHSSALYVLRRNWDVSWFHIAHIVLFAGSAWLFVWRFGLIGYGYAEAVALLSYPVIDRSVRRVIGTPDYRISAFWWVALAIGFFWRDLGWWAIAAPIVAILSPPSIHYLKIYYNMAVSRRLTFQ
jgi:O-antigen/teichoic acid export membrane protein